jgi:TonB-dependent starch-binding outer membrane protein SusC
MRRSVQKWSRLLLSAVICCVCSDTFSQDIAFTAKNQQTEPDSKNTATVQPLTKVLSGLEAQYNVSFAFESRLLQDKAVDIANVLPDGLEKTLDVILAPLQLKYKKIDRKVYVIQSVAPAGQLIDRIDIKQQPAAGDPYGTLVMPVSQNAVKQLIRQTRIIDFAVSGRVTAETGEGLPGVNVVTKGTSSGTVTDINGDYSINVPDASSTLVFSYIGYVAQEVPVNGRSTINISLVPDVQSLNEVVVIGYGTQQRAELTGSVASVNVADARRAPVATVGEAIQGRVPGVTITSSGTPGQTSNINIRGIGSLNAGSGPLYVVDGLWLDNIRDINPADIESIQVLKDAATTAIYGSRGANGVVIITTRKGSAGEPSVNFNAYAGVQNILKRWDLTNAREFAAINNLAHDNANRPRLPGADTQFNPNIDTDWQDEMYKQGSVQEYNLNVSGGGENANYLISGGYFGQQGAILGPSFKRYSLRVNTGFTKGRFRIGQNLLFARSNTVNVNGLPFVDMVRMLPTIPVYDPANPGGFGFGNSNNITYGTNPVALQRLQNSTGLVNRILGNVDATVRIFDFLSYKLNLGLELNNFNDRLERKYGQWRQGDPLDPSFLTENRGERLFSIWENTLNFDRTFGAHSISALVGYTEQRQTSSNTLATNRNYGVGPTYFFVLSAGSTNPQVGGVASEWAKRSYLGQVQYNYDGRYLLTASVRRDGSSRFARENRYGNFGAASVGWRISRETFFENVPVISDLKIRASYGVNGNDNLPNDYLYQRTINQNVNYIFGTAQAVTPGSIQTQLESPGIKWESRYTTNAGIDIGFFDDRVLLNADYYISTTRDALVNPILPFFIGNAGGNPFINLGRLENRGFELGLTYQQTQGDLKYGATANLTTIRNKVLELAYDGQIIVGGPHGGITRTEVGQPVGAFYLLEMQGIFQNAEEITAHGAQPGAQPGDVRYRDVNMDGTINAQDRVFVGSPIPTLQYGINLNAAYRNFDLTVFFQGVAGNQVYNGVRFWLDRMDDNGNYRRDLNPWTGPGTSATTPRPVIVGPSAANNSQAASTRWLENGSYLRLKNIQLGYTLPESVVNRLQVINRLRIYLTGQNVLTFTKYTGLDPETVGSGFFARGVDDGSFPNLRTFTGGIEIGF